MSACAAPLNQNLSRIIFERSFLWEIRKCKETFSLNLNPKPSLE